MSATDPASTTLPAIGRDPLLGFTDEGITLEQVVRDAGQSRTYAGRRSDGQAVQVWIAGDRLAQDAAFVARLRQEAVHLTALRHVHVETCVGHRQWTAPDGRPLVVLVEEASAGIALSELIRREVLPVRDVLRLFHQVASGLAAAHRMGIVHGDITPESVLVTAGGAAKLRGFVLGISGYSAERADRSLIGTPDAMAPEVGHGQQPSSLSDLYGIGVALVTVLTGDAPFSGATALEIIHLHATAPVPNLAVTHGEFAALAPLVARLMAKDPAQRWMEVDDLARDLLLLSSQVPGELRCRPWSGRRPQHLASLVQNALASRQEVTLPPAPRASERSSGGTTTISRNSVEVFRNPDMFKPTGLTPAAGLPILPPTSEAPPTSRTQRRMGPIPPPAAEPPPPSVVVPAKQPSYLSHLAASSPPGAPPSTGGAVVIRRRRTWLGPLFVVVVLVALGLGMLFLRARDAIPETPVVVQPHAQPVERPVADRVAERVAAIVALGARDPVTALAEAAALRREQPQADLAGLPVALRLVVQGPSASAVQVTHAGRRLAVVDGVLCRNRGEPLVLRVSAAGFREVEIEIPAQTADEQSHAVELINEPRWVMPEFAPTWVRLLPAGGDVLLASDRKVVVIASRDGQERRRLDHNASSLLPEGVAWASVLSVTGDRVRLGAVGGLCVATTLPELTAVEEVYRAGASVLAMREVDLTLRLGELGIFLIQRDGLGFTLAGDNRERRLWSKPLKGGMVPWLCNQGDHLLVVGERQIQRFSQEGEESAPVSLPAPRTNEPLRLGADGILVPTLDGVVRLEPAPKPLPGLRGPISALTADVDLVVAAGGRAVTTWRVVGDALVPGWTRQDLIAADRRLVHAAIGDGRVAVVDDAGVVQVFARGDGSPQRTIRTGSALLAPPLLTDGQVVVVLTPGVVAAF